MDVREAYSTWAGTYDSDNNYTRDLDALVTREVLVNHQCNAILELGCGTGKNTVFLAELCQQLFALDFSEGMMGQARTKVAQAHVNFALADFTKPLPIADSCVDLVVCNLVLEHIHDLAFIFGEVYRVLRDGGQFFSCELHPAKQYQGKKAVFQRDDKQTEIPAFVHHISGFLNPAENCGFTLGQLREWWHEADDTSSAPRLVSFMFGKVAPVSGE